MSVSKQQVDVVIPSPQPTLNQNSIRWRFHYSHGSTVVDLVSRSPRLFPCVARMFALISRQSCDKRFSKSTFLRSLRTSSGQSRVSSLAACSAAVVIVLEVSGSGHSTSVSGARSRLETVMRMCRMLLSVVLDDIVGIDEGMVTSCVVGRCLPMFDGGSCGRLPWGNDFIEYSRVGSHLE